MLTDVSRLAIFPESGASLKTLLRKRHRRYGRRLARALTALRGWVGSLGPLTAPLARWQVERTMKADLRDRAVVLLIWRQRPSSDFRSSDLSVSHAQKA